MKHNDTADKDGIEPGLLERFTDSFKKAIRVEMEAMERRLGPFEVPLSDGLGQETNPEDQGRFYTFTVLRSNDKLALHTECTLRSDNSEQLVTVTEIDKDKITLRCGKKVNLVASEHKLVVYPWFLYERLILALDALHDQPDFFISNALMLFGKIPPQIQTTPLNLEHTSLNETQKKAIQLCSNSSTAFVWGPPGTGKTTTLGHIVIELLSQGKRILVTSTTNAAVDQALEKLAQLSDAEKHFAKGSIVRVGQASGDTFGASLPEVLKLLNSENLAKVDQLRSRLGKIKKRIQYCQNIVKKLETTGQPEQLSFFGEAKSPTIDCNELRQVYSEKRSETIFGLSPEQQLPAIQNRNNRLDLLVSLYRQQIIRITEEIRKQEGPVIRKAGVILSTMANVTISSLLQGERFDVVIVEEAGMAVLPTLFYCAALAREKLIMVGDPKQLPPIVQSSQSYVQKVMGRNIFDVALNDLAESDLVVMLNIQYRMHRVIGDLVSRLFYHGRIQNGADEMESEQISTREPYPGLPLVVVDTRNQTRCETREASFSRFNEKTAQFCADLARAAVRSGMQSVAVITPYVAQAQLINQLVRNFSREAASIECRTVHRFQGGERELVILDTVDAVPLAPGILLSGKSPGSSAENLINVAISRAKGKLIIVADVVYFKEKAPGSIMTKMLQEATKTGKLTSMP